MDICAINDIETMLEEGRRLAQAHHNMAAIECFDAGLARMGLRYHDARVVDDTGLKLTLAEHMQAEKNTAQAARLKQGILEDRIVIFKQKNGCP